MELGNNNVRLLFTDACEFGCGRTNNSSVRNGLLPFLLDGFRRAKYGLLEWDI